MSKQDVYYAIALSVSIFGSLAYAIIKLNII